MDGILIVVSGYSGVGKGTLVKKLLETYPEEFTVSVSATSRKPRPGEIDGKDYSFVTKEAFLEMIGKNELLEYNNYNGNYYGTPQEPVLREMASGKNLILEIDVNGGMHIKERYPEAFLLYIVPPEASSIYQRLIKRGSETEEEIRRRMIRAIDETEYMSQYDLVLVNDDFDRCFAEMVEVIREKRVYLQQIHELEEKLREELITITKGEQ